SQQFMGQAGLAQEQAGLDAKAAALSQPFTMPPAPSADSSSFDRDTQNWLRQGQINLQQQQAQAGLAAAQAKGQSALEGQYENLGKLGFADPTAFQREVDAVQGA